MSSFVLFVLLLSIDLIISIRCGEVGLSGRWSEREASGRELPTLGEPRVMHHHPALELFTISGQARAGIGDEARLGFEARGDLGERGRLLTPAFSALIGVSDHKLVGCGLLRSVGRDGRGLIRFEARFLARVFSDDGEGGGRIG